MTANGSQSTPEWFLYYQDLLSHSLHPVSAQVTLHDALEITDGMYRPPSDPCWCASRVRTGVVVGSVQSGKTASMIGVAARALDRGVNVLVILAGSRTALWKQTTLRFYQQLVGEMHRYSCEFYPRPGNEVGLPGTYTVPENRISHSIKKGRPFIFVLQKHHAHLAALATQLKERIYPALKAAGEPVRLLVIDDEADDASIADCDKPSQHDFTETPRRIAELWEDRIRPGRMADDHVYATYLAYTATPQANFLQDKINPLLPKHYFAVLRTPARQGELEPHDLTYAVPGLKNWYTGAQIYYNDLVSHVCVTEQSTGEELGQIWQGIEDVPDDYARIVSAIRTYLVSAAVYQLQADCLGPASAQTEPFDTREEVEAFCAPVTCMLIHPSASMHEHEEIASFIRAWWDGPEGNAQGVTEDLQTHTALWHDVFESLKVSSHAVVEIFGSDQVQERVFPTWADTLNWIYTELVPATRVRVINSSPSSDDRPEFTPWSDEHGTWHAPRHHSTIFVSGNVMSRGLTLEGLLTTVFSRNPTLPLDDSRMQMQRWFGYRGAYIDLCRLYISKAILKQFQDYHSRDLTLRRQLLDARKRGEASVPEVFSGLFSRPTGKVRDQELRSWAPPHKPVVMQLNHPDDDLWNQQLVAGLFSRDDVIAHESGLLLGDEFTISQVADLLDRLRYTTFAHFHDEAKVWEQRAHTIGLTPEDNAWPLYRPPSLPYAPSLITPGQSPYSLAAYFRLWNAMLEGHVVHGIKTNDVYPLDWNLLTAGTAPTFRVGLRFGSRHAATISHGPLSSLNAAVYPMQRAVDDNYALEAPWGSRNVAPSGITGDDAFDYKVLNRYVTPDTVGARPAQTPGLLLFMPIQPKGADAPSLAVGLSIPRGGPDVFVSENPRNRDPLPEAQVSSIQ